MPVMVPDLRAAFAGAGPAAARMIIWIISGIGCAVGPRTRQNVMLVRLIAAPVHAIAVFVQSGSFDDVWAQMKLIQIAGDQFATSVIPRAETDPIAS